MGFFIFCKLSAQQEQECKVLKDSRRLALNKELVTVQGRNVETFLLPPVDLEKMRHASSKGRGSDTLSQFLSQEFRCLLRG